MLDQKFDLPKFNNAGSVKSNIAEPKQIINSPDAAPNSLQIQEISDEGFQKIVISSKYGNLKGCS